MSGNGTRPANFVLTPEETLTYASHAVLLTGPLLAAMLLIFLFVATLLVPNKSWRPWRWKNSTFALWRDFSFRLNRFRAARPAHFRPLSFDTRRLGEVPEIITADGVREMIAHIQDGDIERLVEEARRVADHKLMGGDHYRMTEAVPFTEPVGNDGVRRRGKATANPTFSGSPTSTDHLVEMEEFAPGSSPAAGGGRPQGMDANDPVVQRCMAEVRAIFRKLRDVEHVIEVLGRLPNHRRAQRIVLEHPRLLGGYFTAMDADAGTMKHLLWIKALAVLEYLPPQMPLQNDWIDETHQDTLDGVKFVLERLLGSDKAVAERTGRHGTQIRTLMTESLRLLERRGFMHGVRKTLLQLTPPRRPAGDARHWMRFLERKAVGNRRILWSHPKSSLPHEDKKKLEILLEIPDVEMPPSTDELCGLESALKHRYAEAATQWLTDSTVFLELGLMIQRVLVVHHMKHWRCPNGAGERGEWIESEHVGAEQLWDELMQGKGADNVKAYGDLKRASNLLAFMDPEGVRHNCLAFRKLLDSDVLKRYFQVSCKVSTAENGSKIKRFYCRAWYEAVNTPYEQATRVDSPDGSPPARRRFDWPIEGLLESWEKNVEVEDESRKARAGRAGVDAVAFRDRYDPREDPHCDAYTRPYGEEFAIITLRGTGDDEFYFYKVEQRLDEGSGRRASPPPGRAEGSRPRSAIRAYEVPLQPPKHMQTREAKEREGRSRPWQVTPLHPNGEIGPFIDLSELNGLPKKHGETAWGVRNFDFFDENFRFNRKHTQTNKTVVGAVLNAITFGGWVNQRTDRESRVRGVRVKASVTVQEPAVKVTTAEGVAAVRRYRHTGGSVHEQEPDAMHTIICKVTINLETEPDFTWYQFVSWAQGRQRELFGLQRRVIDLRFSTRKYGPGGKAWGVSLGFGASKAEEQEDIGILSAIGGTVKRYDTTPDGLARLDAFQRDEFRMEMRTLFRKKVPETVGEPLTISLYPDIYTNPDMPELAQARAKDSMNFWDPNIRPARGSIIARVEWDGPLLEREADDIACEIAVAEREASRHGKRSDRREEILGHASNVQLVENRSRLHRRVGKEPWYYPSSVLSYIAGQVEWIVEHLGATDWELTEHREEAVQWAAHLAFREKFFEDCALTLELDSTTQTSENYVYRSRRAIAWGLRTPAKVDQAHQRLEFSIGAKEKHLPGRWFEHLAEVAVAARYSELLAVVFLSVVIFWKQTVADAHMLEKNLEQYCTDEDLELTQCWATNVSYYYELKDADLTFIDCSGNEPPFKRMICFLPPSGQEFDAALVISGIGIAWSVFKSIALATGVGMFSVFPSGRRGISTTVWLLFLIVFSFGSLIFLFGLLSGTTRFTGQYDLSVLSTVLIMASGIIIMIHAIIYKYKHEMVLHEIENFDFGAVSDDDFVQRRTREPYAVMSYSMPGLGRQDEFVSANKPWASKWYTDRTEKPSSLPAGFGPDISYGGAVEARQRSAAMGGGGLNLSVDDNLKYDC